MSAPVSAVLDELHIHGLGVIERASLHLAPGLTVITGETGAGKTMVVTALQLLLGTRADSDLVRAGAPSARVEARFSPPPPEAADWLDDGDAELLVAREIPADGRSKARINGRLAPVGALADVLGPHIDVHAQHDHHRLTRPAVQRELLDAYAGEPHARTLAAYRDAYRAWQKARRELEQLEDTARERARELDRLRFELDEIGAASVDLDADASIDDEIALLDHAEALRTGLATAAAALGSDGAQEPVGVAVTALRRLPVHAGDLQDLQDRAEALAELTADLAADLRAAMESVDADPARLDELMSRRQVLHGLQRKYGDDLAAVLTYEARAVARVGELEQMSDASDGLAERVATLDAEVGDLARAVHDQRVVAAERLAASVQGHLADLAMPHAHVEIVVTLTDPGPDGADDVAFLLAPNPGEPARPLATAASGGERSRVALAIEVALTDVEDVAVLVFDEVDAGIGGATAMAVGEKLARLAAGGRRQVLVVTHLAQLAAYADVHHVVEKGISGGRTVTTARAVAADDRVGELSRMLGGDTGDAARAHARELLDEAHRRRAS
jgi:DNA repair protein RecN (Recombination protein N)